MPNVYCTLAQIKDALKLTSVEYDTQLLRIAEAKSRQFDRDTDQFYYVYEGTFYQDGGATRVVLDWPIQTISYLYVDTAGDNTYPDTYTVDMNSPTTAPDAFAYPFNGLPKTRLEANPMGSYGHLGAGFRRALKIVGTFGYGNDWPAPYYHTADSSLGGDLTSTGATVYVTASTASELSGGQTLWINDEQVFVKSDPSGSSCPIVRAQNGTAAAAATTGTAVYVADYPQDVVSAVLVETVREWKRRESGYVNNIINTDMGSIQVYKGLDPIYTEAVKKYRRLRIGSYF